MYAKDYSISIVIPVFNDRTGLRKCLEALAGQSHDGRRAELIVVDNGSREAIVDIVSEFEDIIPLTEPRPGSYAARNRGVREARGDILAFIDSDCVAAERWIENGVRALIEAGPEAVIGGRVEITVRDRHNLSTAEIFDTVCAFPMRQYVEQKKFAGTGNLFAFREAFDVVGLFNAALRSGGDREWSLRAGARGYRVVYADDVVVHHPARTTVAQLIRKKRRTVGGGVKLRQIMPGYPPAEERRGPSLLYVNARNFIGSRAEPGGVKPRAVLIAVLVVLWIVATAERIRLALGGEPTR